MNKKKGFFITFEGCEGTGKSTQSKKLYEYLKTKNNKIIYTREPGGCKEAEQIREILVNGHVNKWDGITESLLHNAARKVHLKKTIIPALNNNNWVICDRFIDSTNAYQGAGQGVPIDFLKNLSNIVCQDIRPDLTISSVIKFIQDKKKGRTKWWYSGEAYRKSNIKSNSVVKKQTGFEIYASNNKNKDDQEIIQTSVNILKKTTSCPWHKKKKVLLIIVQRM